MKRVLLFALTILFSLSLASCGESKYNNEGEYDDITKTCSLEKAYEGKNFFTDGIGKATLSKTTDGDTANFLLESDQVVIIRFYGVDTPESTGSVEKWGKAASLFTKKVLEGAKEIVLEASTTPASHDSYGTRYLAYVWYRNSEGEEFKNLCLELVENGFSANKCINTSAYAYYSYFKQAEDFAKKYSLRVNGDGVDQYYSTAALNITIKDFRDNIETYYNKEADSGSKVRIRAYITDLRISSSSTYTFVAEQVIDGVKYTIDIYAGYSSSPVANVMKIGNLYTITGSIQLHNGSYQISGLTYVAMQSGGDYLTVAQRDYYLTFNSSTPYESKWGTALLSDATITEATLDGTKLTLKATAQVKTASGYLEADTYVFEVNVDASDIEDVSSLVGQSLSTKGYQYEKNSKVITILDFKDIQFK